MFITQAVLTRVKNQDMFGGDTYIPFLRDERASKGSISGGIFSLVAYGLFAAYAII